MKVKKCNSGKTVIINGLKFKAQGGFLVLCDTIKPFGAFHTYARQNALVF